MDLPPECRVSSRSWTESTRWVPHYSFRESPKELHTRVRGGSQFVCVGSETFYRSPTSQGQIYNISTSPPTRLTTNQPTYAL